MRKRSAGILMYRWADDELQVLLAHPGGPFWKNKDLGSWSIPKGEHAESEEPLMAAVREFSEETGASIDGDFKPLGDIVQPSRKAVAAWAVEGDFDPAALTSNTFEMEWPPHSGRVQSFPEIDRVAWFGLPEARRKILPGQTAFLDRLAESLARR